MRTDYCIAFAFSDDNKEVALIKKNRPHWQKDKYNGIGGKINEGELPIEAIVREFNEETNCIAYNFLKFAILDFSNALVHCYKLNISLELLESPTDEIVEIFPVDNLPKNLVNDVAWLVPMCTNSFYIHDIKISKPCPTTKKL